VTPLLAETKEGASAILARAVADSFARLRGLHTAQAEAAAALRATALGVLKEWEGIETNVGEINRRYEAKAMQLLDATNSRCELILFHTVRHSSSLLPAP
jgi:hypothetical protein